MDGMMALGRIALSRRKHDYLEREKVGVGVLGLILAYPRLNSQSVLFLFPSAKHLLPEHILGVDISGPGAWGRRGGLQTSIRFHELYR